MLYHQMERLDVLKTALQSGGVSYPFFFSTDLNE